MNGELKLLSSLLPEDEHLQYDELEAVARGAKNEHVQWCETCAAEVADLRHMLPLAPLAGRGWRAAPGEGLRRLLAVAALVAVVITSVLFLRYRNAAEALRLAEVPIPTAMRGERLQLRGAAASAALAVVEPVGTAVVSDRPTFRWNAPFPVRVEIFDERFRLVAQSDPLTASEWAPPSPLPRDRTYLWQVVTADEHEHLLAPVPPLPDARFRVVSAEEARRIEAARGPSLERASLYAGAGALDEASRELKRLPDTEAVRRLRDRVDNLR